MADSIFLSLVDRALIGFSLTCPCTSAGLQEKFSNSLAPPACEEAVALWTLVLPSPFFAPNVCSFVRREFAPSSSVLKISE